MKKLIVLLVIMVYGLTSTGAIVHLDYCCGKLANISLSTSPMEDCKDDGMKANSCCDSKHVILKVKGEQEVAVKWMNTQKQSAFPIAFVHDQHEVTTSFKPSNEFSTGPPAPDSQVPLFIQHCLFRI